MLDWIVINRTVFICWTELFEMELFWHLTTCQQKIISKPNRVVWNFYENDLIRR